MFGYLFKRFILVMFIGMTVLFTLSFYIPDYYYTHYHNVKILSEKSEMVRNTGCNDPNHDHHMVKVITVKWIGENRNGEKVEFTNTFDDENDSDDGVAYNDLKQGFAKDHNCCHSVFTWIGFITFLLAFVLIYLPEDLEDDYTWRESDEIRKWRLDWWHDIAIFFGYNPDIVEIVHDSEEKLNNSRIPLYSELFSLYKKEQEKLSQIKVESNEK